MRKGWSRRDVLDHTAADCLRTPPEARTPNHRAALMTWLRKHARMHDVEKLEKLCEHMRMQVYDVNTCVYKTGDVGLSYHIIFSGEVGMYHDQVDDTEIADQLIMTCKPGMSFGELSLLSDVPHSLTARVHAHANIIEIDKQYFVEHIKHGSGVFEDDTAIVEAIANGPGWRSPLQSAALLSWSEAKLPQSFGGKVSIPQLTNVLELETHAASSVIYSQGDPGDVFYVVYSGEVGLYLESGSKGLSLAERIGKRMRTVTEGQGFGDMSLLTGQPRELTARAHKDVKLLAVQRSAFKRVVAQHFGTGEQASALEALQTIADDRTPQHQADLLAWARKHVKIKGDVRMDLLCRQMEFVQLDQGNVLFRQGDAGDAYYLVFEGDVGMHIEPRNPDRDYDAEPGACVVIMHSGDGFGELALLRGQPRALTARMHSDAKLIRIRRDAYQELVSQSMYREMKQKSAHVKEALISSTGLPPPEAVLQRVTYAFELNKASRSFTWLQRQDATPQRIFLIVSGHVRVEIRRNAHSRPVHVATLGAGSLVGEFRHNAISCSVSIMVDSKVCEYMSTSYQDFFTRIGPDLGGALVQKFEKELHGWEKRANFVSPSKSTGSKLQLQSIADKLFKREKMLATAAKQDNGTIPTNIHTPPNFQREQGTSPPKIFLRTTPEEDEPTTPLKVTVVTSPRASQTKLPGLVGSMSIPEKLNWFADKDRDWARTLPPSLADVRKDTSPKYATTRLPPLETDFVGLSGRVVRTGQRCRTPPGRPHRRGDTNVGRASWPSRGTHHQQQSRNVLLPRRVR